MPTWQPIETAPTDGTRILAADNDGFVFICYAQGGSGGRPTWYSSSQSYLIGKRGGPSREMGGGVEDWHCPAPIKWLPVPSPVVPEPRP